MAGLASTIFAPLTHVLVEQLGWRGAYPAPTTVLAVVTVPLHGLALSAPWHPGDVSPGARSGRHRPPPEVRSAPFLVLAVALTTGAFGMYAAGLTLIPTLVAKGVSPGLAAPPWACSARGSWPGGWPTDR